MKPTEPTSPKIIKAFGQFTQRDWKEVRDLKPNEDTGSILRLQDFGDFLLDFINAPNLIVLAGSGTSLGKEVGGPSMGHLWDEVSSIAEFNDVLNIVQHPPHERNVESLLSRCKGAGQYIGEKEKRDKLGTFVSAAEDKIYHKCNDFLEKADLKHHREFLRRMARRSVSKPRLRLFTTNYDRCFEQAAGELSFVVIDGFSFSMPRRYSASCFKHDIVNRNARVHEAPEFVESVFHLLKLHGSVDWDAVKNGIIQSAKPKKRCLIYPANTKFELSYTQPYLEMMAQFLMAIREPNTSLLVIGFGFNDDHLTAPIRSAVEANAGMRLLVVDPSCESKSQQSDTFHEHLRRCVENQDDRVVMVNADFGAFASHIPNLARATQQEKLVEIIKNVSKRS